MNFLLVGPDFPPSAGGISTYTKGLAAALAKSHEVTVLAPGAFDAVSLDRSCPFRIVRTPPIPGLSTVAFFVYIPWLTRRLHIGAVLHTVWTTALISHFWRYLVPVPYFVSVHGSEIRDDTRTWRRCLKSFLRRWRYAALCKANGIFPVSLYSAGIVMDLGIDKNRIQVISGGVDPDRFRPAQNDRERTGPGKILTVARLDLHKGHDRVLEALVILKEEGLTPCYIIAGEGEEKTRLYEMTKTLGLEKQVIFAGFVPESQLPGLYADADIFVMPSREIPGRLDLIEGFGISFLEAGASGLPVVAGLSGGVPDVVRHGENGLLVDPNDQKEIAHALKLLLSDKKLAMQMGKEGRRRAETQMSWQSVSERLCDAVRRLIIATQAMS